MLPSVDRSARAVAKNYAVFSEGVARSLTRLSSGKRFRNAGEDIVAYTRSQNHRFQFNTYSSIKRNLDEWSTTLDVAATAAEQVHDGLIRMKELWNLAGQGGPEQKDAYQVEFRQIARTIDMIVRTTAHNSHAVLNTAGTLAEVAVAPGTAAENKVAIAPGQAIVEDGTVNNLTALLSADIGSTSSDMPGALAAVDAALGDVQSFLGKLGASSRAVSAFSSIAASVMANSQSAESVIAGVDEAQETLAFTRTEVRRQASLAMLAQANLSYRSVLILYGLKGGE